MLCHKQGVMSKLLLSDVCSCVVNASGALLHSALFTPAFEGLGFGGDVHNSLSVLGAPEDAGRKGNDHIKWHH